MKHIRFSEISKELLGVDLANGYRIGTSTFDSISYIQESNSYINQYMSLLPADVMELGFESFWGAKQNEITFSANDYR